MIVRTKRFARLTGAGLALVVALALGAGPVLAAQERGLAGCLVEAVEDYGECLGEATGFWDRVNCSVVLFLDAVDCVF